MPKKKLNPNLDLVTYLKAHKPKKFKPSILYNKEGKCLDIYLEDVAYYSEWIKGERAYISLHRAMYEGNGKPADRIVGATLPFDGNPKDLKLVIV